MAEDKKQPKPEPKATREQLRDLTEEFIEGPEEEDENTGTQKK